MSQKRSERVLVLDGDMVASLAIARSLHRLGCETSLAAHEDRPVSAYSRAVSHFHVYPDPLHDAEEFVDWLHSHLQCQSYDLVIPVTERTLTPLACRRELFASTRIALPDNSALEPVLDKSRTLALAQRLDVPIPRSVTVHSPEELAEQSGRRDFPLVLKPARSLGSRDGAASHLRVSYAFDDPGMLAGARHMLRFGPVVLQEYFAGAGVGIELIAQRGQVVYAFQHRRLHEVPLTGGGSSLRISETPATELLEASKRLMAALEWHGVAMVEFKYNDKTGEFCLMEINGRFWGSLPLAVAAGADFPAMLLSLMVDGSVTPCAPYRRGVYCRLLSKDLMWHEAVLRGGQHERLVHPPGRKELLLSLALVLHPRHRFDVQSLRDPLPGLVDASDIVRAYCGRLRGLVAERLYLGRQRRAWRRGQVDKRLSAAGSVLFLCYGNINRSALADALLRGYAEDTGVNVFSAGFHPQVGRPPDPVMVEVAADHGVDMRELRSSTVDREMVQGSDIIFVMEKRHRDRLLEMEPGADDRIFLLGAVPGGADLTGEIGDPFGQTRESYLACFARIARAIDHIKAVLAARSPD